MNPLNGVLVGSGSGGAGGAGDVVGPGSSTAGNLAEFGDTSGALLADSGIASASVIVGSLGAADDAILITNGTGGQTAAASAATLTAAGSLTIPAAETIEFSTDTGLARTSAGVVKITNGGAGFGMVEVRSGTAAAPSIQPGSAGNLALMGNGGGTKVALGTNSTNLVVVSTEGATVRSSDGGYGFSADPINAPDTRMVRAGAAGAFGFAHYSNGMANNIKIATTTVTATGATSTATNLVPAGCILLGVTTRVTTAITSGDGGTSVDIGNGTIANAYADDVAFTLGTTTKLTDHQESPLKFVAGAESVVFTCNGGTFATGQWRVCVHYLDLTAPTS